MFVFTRKMIYCSSSTLVLFSRPTNCVTALKPLSDRCCDVSVCGGLTLVWHACAPPPPTRRAPDWVTTAGCLVPRDQSCSRWVALLCRLWLCSRTTNGLWCALLLGTKVVIMCCHINLFLLTTYCFLMSHIVICQISFPVFYWIIQCMCSTFLFCVGFPKVLKTSSAHDFCVRYDCFLGKATEALLSVKVSLVCIVHVIYWTCADKVQVTLLCHGLNTMLTTVSYTFADKLGPLAKTHALNFLSSLSHVPPSLGSLLFPPSAPLIISELLCFLWPVRPQWSVLL